MKKQKTVKKKSFFDYTKNIINLKNRQLMEDDMRDPTFGSTFSVYMTLRYLSMVPEFLKIIADHQIAIQHMDSETAYRFLFKIIPQRRNLWVQYISKKKKKA